MARHPVSHRVQDPAGWVGDGGVGAAQWSVTSLSLSLRRRWLTLVAFMIAGLFGGAVYLHLTPPQFIATTQLVLRPRHIATDGPEQLRAYHQFALDGEQANTHLQVIRSERLARGVFQALDLSADPELHRPDIGLWSSLTALWQQVTHTTQDGDGVLLRRMMDRMAARRLGLSYVIEIAYRSSDPALATRVVNAVAVSYARDRADDAQTGAPYIKDRAVALLGDRMMAKEAIARGQFPPRAFAADADIRLLGAALPPQAPVFPRKGPVLCLAAFWGVLGGLVVLVGRHQAGRRIWDARSLRFLTVHQTTL